MPDIYGDFIQLDNILRPERQTAFLVRNCGW